MHEKLPSISSMLNNGDSTKTVSNKPLPGMSNASYPMGTKTLLNNVPTQQDNYAPGGSTGYMGQQDTKQLLTIPVMNNQYNYPTSPYMTSMKYNGQMRVTPVNASVYSQFPSASAPNFPMNTHSSYSDSHMGFSNVNTPITSTQHVMSQNYNNPYPIRNRSPLDINTSMKVHNMPMIYNMSRSANTSPIMVQQTNCNNNNDSDNKVLLRTNNYTPTQMFFNSRFNEAPEGSMQPSMGGYDMYLQRDPSPKSVPPRKNSKDNKKSPKSKEKTSPVDLNFEPPAKKVPRPRNAFILFRQHYHKIIFKEQSDLLLKNKDTSENEETGVDSFKLNSTVSKAIGFKWKNLPEEEKSHWVGLAEKEKTEHSLKYPDYKYVPKRRKTISTVMSFTKN